MKKFIFGIGCVVCIRFVLGFIAGLIVRIMNANGANIDIITWPTWVFIFLG